MRFGTTTITSIRHVALVIVLACGGCAHFGSSSSKLGAGAAMTFRDNDGWVYVYGSPSAKYHLPLERTRDFKSFQSLGDAVPVMPEWAADGGVESPYVVAGHEGFGENGKYYLFGRAAYLQKSVTADRPGNAIFVATASSPSGPFEPINGSLLVKDTGDRVLDAMVFVDPPSSKAYLIYGGVNEPVRKRELAKSLIDFKPDSAATEIVFPRNAIRGAALTYRSGARYPYILYANGEDQGLTAFVGFTLDGPFFGVSRVDSNRPDNVIARGDDPLRRTGHGNMFRDASGNDFIVYNALGPKSHMLRDLELGRITYDAMGLPVIGATP